MRSTLFAVVGLGLSALVKAGGFTSPKSGDKWTKGQSQMISWDKSAMGSDCSLYLVPAGATDITTVLSEIATSVSNSGSYSWTPESSIAASEAEIIIVDSSTTIISSNFWLISSSSDNGSYKGSGKGSGSYSSNGSYGSGSKNSSHGSHDTGKTKTYQSHETMTHGSGETTSFLTFSISGSYYTKSTVLTTTQVTTTVQGAAASAAASTTVAPPEAVTTSSPSVYTSVSSGSNSSGTLAVNATPTAITFTGEAASSQSHLYAAVVGCLAGLAAMMSL